ncbi:DUF2283 domain-containing protein [Microbacterium esteraromaticum]|uniref:DUF2283 domain-containing protein n=1 Tax=Microbacterium esteraromaticum TaxID=57043 RepID=UPI001A8EC112|nr:DUF2283 domain-containing protein [Microbacterium esteraromaticum]MBN8423112.1 DUF2283 domain-containing protein [Microbacterium esteraromaticum]
MRTTFDAVADAVYIELVPGIEPGRSVRNEIVETDGGTVVLDFDRAGILLGVEVLGATELLDGEFLAGAERIDQQ